MITIKDVRRAMEEIDIPFSTDVERFRCADIINLGVNAGWVTSPGPDAVTGFKWTPLGDGISNRVNDRARVLTLECSCCGSPAPAFAQWYNRDTGYGLCPKCRKSITDKEGPEYVQDAYGYAGVHHSIDITGTPVPGDHSECGPDCCITGDLCDGTHAEPKSKKGHTGGEWEVVFDDDPAGGKRVASIRVKEWKDNDLVGDYRGCIIADLTASHGNRPHAYAEAEANAHLMAAAPGLLKALYVALPYIESAESDPAYKAGAVAKVTKQLRAIIAKAEGPLA